MQTRTGETLRQLGHGHAAGDVGEAGVPVIGADLLGGGP